MPWVGLVSFVLHLCFIPFSSEGFLNFWGQVGALERFRNLEHSGSRGGRSGGVVRVLIIL